MSRDVQNWVCEGCNKSFPESRLRLEVSGYLNGETTKASDFCPDCLAAYAPIWKALGRLEIAVRK